MSTTLYPPPSPFTTFSKQASAILQGNPSLNSLNLLELDELLGWAETAKSSSHHSTALDELDKLLGEFNIDSAEQSDKTFADKKRKLARKEIFHTSEGDIRSNTVLQPSRVFSEPRMEIMSPSPLLPSSTSPPSVLLARVDREYHPELLHNFFGRRKLTDEFSDMSSVQHTSPSISSTVYSKSFSSSEQASNYTMFSQNNRREALQGVPFANSKLTLIHQNTLHKDYNTLRGNGTLSRSPKLNGTLNSTLSGSTLRSNPLLKKMSMRKKCRFILCTPV